MENKILLVVNPAAGNGNIEKDIDKIIENFQSSGFKVQTEYTVKEESAENIIERKANDGDIVIAAGGDGTLNEVVNGVTKSKKIVKIGFIPYGTTNDFARTLNIPINKYTLSKEIKNTTETKCDTGEFNGKYFNYVSAFGTFAKTSFATERKMKNRFGRLAYLANGTKDFLEEETNVHLKITTDDQVIEDDFTYGSISNSKYIGGFKMFKNDEVSINDGKFEVLLIKTQKNKAELLKTYASLINQVRDKNVIFLKTSKLKIETDQTMQWSLDGECAETNGEIHINNLNNNINVLTLKA